jgi:tRNA 2-thiocytidine biosynthesis protein TtcA
VSREGFSLRRSTIHTGAEAAFDVRGLASGRHVNRLLGRAISRYGLIAGGDRIAVGLSGGKDSLCLLWLLAERRRRVPVAYSLTAVHIDLGFPEGRAAESLSAFCRRLDVALTIIPTDIGPRAHAPDNPENPCFRCAGLRRKLLFEAAFEAGCNRLALGHHRDDIIHTFFLNVIYASEISTMLPAQPLFGGRLTLIRPLALCDEGHLARLARDLDLPVVPSGCPSQRHSARHEIAELLAPLLGRNRRLKGNVFRALSNVRLDYRPPPPPPPPPPR